MSQKKKGIETLKVKWSKTIQFKTGIGLNRHLIQDTQGPGPVAHPIIPATQKAENGRINSDLMLAWTKSYQELISSNKPGVVAHTCTPRPTWAAIGRRIASLRSAQEKNVRPFPKSN
jgi:hypothetical protein